MSFQVSLVGIRRSVVIFEGSGEFQTCFRMFGIVLVLQMLLVQHISQMQEPVCISKPRISEVLVAFAKGFGDWAYHLCDLVGAFATLTSRVKLCICEVSGRICDILWF